jgi:RNA polymerase sigma-70 factor (ECF subfamily)
VEPIDSARGALSKNSTLAQLFHAEPARNAPAPPLQFVADMTTDSFLSPHAGYLLACARRLTRNEADARDLVQDTCLHAVETLRSSDTLPKNPRGWLAVMMRHRWFNVLRHNKVCRTAHAAIAAEPSADTSLSDTRVIHSQLVRAWSRLSTQSQEIAEQCLIDGDSYDDVSQRFGLTAGGVATSIHRTRESLRQLMFDDAE